MKIMNISQKNKNTIFFSNNRQIIRKYNTVCIKCFNKTFQTSSIFQIRLSNFPKRLFSEKINAAKPDVTNKIKVNKYVILRNATQRLIKLIARMQHQHDKKKTGKRYLAKQIEFLNLVVQQNKDLLREATSLKLTGQYRYKEEDFAYERPVKVLSEKQLQALREGREKWIENLETNRQ